MTPVVHRILLLALAALSVAAVFVVHRIEAAGSPVGRPQLTADFSPDHNGKHDTAQLTFRLRHAGTVSVWFEDHHGHVVRTVWNHHHARRGGVRIAWDGRDGHGRLAPEGAYTATIRLDSSGGRRFRLHRPTTLDITPARISDLQVRAAPHGAPAGTFVLRARVSGPTRRQSVLLDRVTKPQLLRVHRTVRRSGAVDFDLLVRRPTLPALRRFRYLRLVFVVEDTAGNVTRSLIWFDRVTACPGGSDGLLDTRPGSPLPPARLGSCA